MKFMLTKLFSITASLCVIVALLSGLYIAFWPIDVLKNWSLVVDANTAVAGGQITVVSTYTKVRAVNGPASRYLECEHNGVQTRYKLESANANRQPSSQPQATGIILTLPKDIPDLPASCRVTISIDYQIYNFRRFNEYNVSNNFTVYPAGFKIPQ